MAYVKTTATQRKAIANAGIRYLHVSAHVGKAVDPKTGLVVLMQTEKGKGATATRKATKQQIRQLRRAAKKAKVFA